jgi:hypothetical protein
VDNLSTGGLVFDIDMASGRLGKAATGFFGNGLFHWIEMHPDTGLSRKVSLLMAGTAFVGKSKKWRINSHILRTLPGTWFWSMMKFFSSRETRGRMSALMMVLFLNWLALM